MKFYNLKFFWSSWVRTKCEINALQSFNGSFNLQHLYIFAMWWKLCNFTYSYWVNLASIVFNNFSQCKWQPCIAFTYQTKLFQMPLERKSSTFLLSLNFIPSTKADSQNTMSRTNHFNLNYSRIIFKLQTAFPQTFPFQ